VEGKLVANEEAYAVVRGLLFFAGVEHTFCSKKETQPMNPEPLALLTSDEIAVDPMFRLFRGGLDVAR